MVSRRIVCKFIDCSILQSLSVTRNKRRFQVNVTHLKPRSDVLEHSVAGLI